MGLGIYLGAADATDGTLEDPGDGVGITLGNIGSVAMFHIRAESGYENAEVVTVNSPAECEVSSNGKAYADVATYAVGAIKDTNRSCYVKRVTGIAASITGLILTPRLALINTRAKTVYTGEFTPVVSSILSDRCTVSFETSYPNTEDFTYKVAVTSSFDPPEWTDYPDCVSPHVAKGLLPDTTYFAHVRASDGTLVNVETSPSFKTIIYVDSTPPSLVGVLNVIPGKEEFILNWPDATDNEGVVEYQVEYGTSLNYGSSVTPEVVESTVTISGILNGAQYYFRVRARDSAGNVSSWITAYASTAIFVDTFDSLNTSRWGTCLAADGTAAIVNGALELETGSKESASMIFLRNPIEPGLNYSARVKVNSIGIGGGTPLVMALYDNIGEPEPYQSGNLVTGHVITVALSASLAYISFIAEQGEKRFWTGLSWTETPTPCHNYALNTYYTTRIETDATGWRVVLINSSGTEIDSTNWVPWTTTRGLLGNRYLVLGDGSVDLERYKMTVDSVEVA